LYNFEKEARVENRGKSREKRQEVKERGKLTES